MPIPPQTPPSCHSQRAHVHIPTLSPRWTSQPSHPTPGSCECRALHKSDARMSIRGADFSQAAVPGKTLVSCLFTFPAASSYLHSPQQVPKAHVLLPDEWFLKGRKDHKDQEAGAGLGPWQPGTTITPPKSPQVRTARRACRGRGCSKISPPCPGSPVSWPATAGCPF